MGDEQQNTTAQQSYPRAPITEAIIDFQFTEPLGMSECERLKSKLDERYPVVAPWNEVSIVVDAGKRSTNFEEITRGYRLSSLDQTDVVIVANTRFASSRLAPYLGWEQFRGRAANNWSILKGIIGYKKVKRIGVRYVNRIDIPSQQGKPIELSDYFALFLHVPQPPFPQVADQTIQTIFAFEDCVVIVNTGTIPSPLLDHRSIALDIDFGRDKEVPQADDAIWAYIDDIRGRKNSLFEASITERTRKLFK